MSLSIPKKKIEKDIFITLILNLAIEYIQQEYNPDEVYERDKLDEWIFNDGWVKPEKNGKLINRTVFFGEHVKEAINTIKTWMKDL